MIIRIRESSIETILHTTKLCFTTDGRLEVYDHKLATKFNKIFKKWNDGKYKFKEGEEAFFKVPSDRIQSFTTLVLNLKSKDNWLAVGYPTP